MVGIRWVDEGGGQVIPALVPEVKIHGSWVIALRDTCEELHALANAFCLNLTGVAFIVWVGLRMLREPMPWLHLTRSFA